MTFRPFYAALALTFSFAGQALAHAHLEKASPAADATVAAPEAIEMTFTEPLELKMSSAMVMTPAGGMIEADAPKLGADGMTLILPLKAKPAPGTYSVMWQVLSTDGHKSNGTYAFTVK